ncbi:MAG TPA: trypsin-like peptidase domain-containing protein, partial [Povalibacter sp.]|nr:trypsin-like peptidase domain-containing protein [Povalibacter sp.]
ISVPPAVQLSDKDISAFSGIGIIACSVDSGIQTATAFLVGAFDIGVTVAHTFEDARTGVEATDCVYTSIDSLGQIRERISISYVRSQWAAEAGAAGHTSKDFAVVRLSEPSHYAQRTMPMGKFSGNAVSVLMIGFRDDMESDPLKSKSRGTVYERRIDSRSLAALEGFTHDIDARGIADGSPVIDENTGVIIGIHTAHVQASDGFTMMRNTMITMNDWLEQTLRAEMQLHDEKGANSAL